MKNKVIILCLSILLLLGAFVAMSQYITKKEKERVDLIFQEAERINENSNLGLIYLEEKHATPTDNIIDEDQSSVGMKEPDVTVGDSWEVYGYYNQLDSSNSLYLTSIIISRASENYHIFGVKIGDDLQNSVDKLVNEGYEILETPESSTSVELEKNGICITLYSSSGSGDEREVHSVLVRAKTKDGYKQY